MNASITVRVPAEVRTALETKAAEAGFKNLSAYARYVLEQSLDAVDVPTSPPSTSDPHPTTTGTPDATSTTLFAYRMPGVHRPPLQRPAPLPFKPNTLKTND